MPKYIVRYGVMPSLGVLLARGSERLARGTRVITRTPRGMEAGEVLCEATEHAVSQLKDPASGQIVRKMTPEDENELQHVQSNDRRTFEKCRDHVAQLGLQMELVEVENIFGGECVVVYYLAEKRVDFRELVKRLASEFQTRVEMRQIGIRDEAKLLADYGDCGKPVCCNTHLSAMPPVSMKMAKLQKATLDPTKISGRCGRLKCCLRYEYDTYESIQAELPPIGSEILTRAGRALVLGHEILAEQLLIETDDRRRVTIPASDVLSVVSRGSGRVKRPPRRENETAAGETGRRRGNSRGKANSDRTAAESATGAAASPTDAPAGDTPTSRHSASERGKGGARSKKSSRRRRDRRSGRSNVPSNRSDTEGRARPPNPPTSDSPSGDSQSTKTDSPHADTPRQPPPPPDLPE